MHRTRRSAPLAALLAWVMPGLGHWYLGERSRAVIFFVVTTVMFWGGVAIGGVRSTVTPRENGPWIAAQLCMGPQAAVALVLSWQARETSGNQYKAPWPASSISVVYAGITGLLNLLIIIDALARADATESLRVAGATTHRSRVTRAPPRRSSIG
ncbi:MAG: hypothetical protein O7F76_07805 [Planctomycetota bacterium]|nr:hypothetical protein [Planctomycetota bacterium]